MSEIPRNYKTYIEYVQDKNKAEYYIRNKMDIPPQLFNKLVEARVDLESRGILEPLEIKERDMK